MNNIYEATRWCHSHYPKEWKHFLDNVNHEDTAALVAEQFLRDLLPTRSLRLTLRQNADKSWVAYLDTDDGTSFIAAHTSPLVAITNALNEAIGK